MPWQQRKGPAASVFSKEDREVNASSDVTLALRRTYNMMREELNKSQFSRDMLRDSKAALEQLSDTYSNLDTLLSSSKNLLGTLLRSQKSDTWYLETAFYILLVTIGWLVFRRILWWPFWLFASPLRLAVQASVSIISTLVSSGKDIGGASLVEGDTMVPGDAARATIGGSDAPTISVGGDNTRLSARQTDTPQDESMSEQVGRIIDESQEQDLAENSEPIIDTGEPEEAVPVEPQKNPKKRMWEEEKEAVNEERRTKDEL